MADRAGFEARATLVVTRPPGGYRDAVRSYAVLVDGEQVAKLASGQEVTVDLAAGRHMVQAQINWTGSPEVELTLSAGERVAFVVDAAGGPFRLDQLFGKDRYLTLKRVD